ncbi:hypothetical protein [Methylorubrum thiocyanatum]
MLASNNISAFAAQAATHQSAAAPVLSSHACVPAPAPANDDVADYLDRELADLPLDFSDVPPVPVVTNLDGSPAEPEPAPVAVPDPVTRAALHRRRAGAGEAFDHHPTRTAPKPRKRAIAARINVSDVPHVIAVSPVPSEAGNDDAGPCVKKKRSASSRISLLGDRAFLNDYKALTGISEGIAPVQAGVSSIVGMGRGSAPTDPLPSFMTKAPRPWASATDETKAHFALEALRARGPVVAFTAWTSQEISDQTYATDKPLPWLRKRVAEALGGAFGPVEWFADLEEEKTGRGGDRKRRLHLHGALNIENPSRRRLALLRMVLRRAMGPWDGSALKFQVMLKLDPDAGWASYCSKRSWLALPGIRARFACDRPGSPWRLGFDGPVLTMTNGIRAEAQALHQKAREIVQEARQRAATLEALETTPALLEPPYEPAVVPQPASEADVATPARPARAEIQAEIYIGLAFTAPALPALDGPFRMPATARSRGPPARVRSPSAGLDPPLAERLLIGEITEHELPALAVAERVDNRAGHEAGLPSDDGLSVDPRPASHRDDGRWVRVSDRPCSRTTDRAGAGDPELPNAHVAARSLPSRSGAVGKLSSDGIAKMGALSTGSGAAGGQTAPAARGARGD